MKKLNVIKLVEKFKINHQNKKKIITIHRTISSYIQAINIKHH